MKLQIKPEKLAQSIKQKKTSPPGGFFCPFFNMVPDYKKKIQHQKDRKDFSKEEERAVWEKAQLTDDPNVRLDICGQEIHFDKYGDTGLDYGWEIDHIKPVSKGGGDEIDNLQPLYWKTNRQKGDSWPVNPTDYCQGR